MKGILATSYCIDVIHNLFQSQRRMVLDVTISSYCVNSGPDSPT